MTGALLLVPKSDVVTGVAKAALRARLKAEIVCGVVDQVPLFAL